MNFTNLDIEVSLGDISEIEASLGLVFPDSLKTLFTDHNGGEPDPYVFRNDMIHTVVHETLPLISGENRGTAVEAYKLLVIDREVVPYNFFPFAVDAGGDYFFADCDSVDADVYFYYFGNGSGRMNRLNVGLAGFWGELREEE